MQEVVELSKALIGKIIVRKLKDGKMLKCMIVEAEAFIIYFCYFYFLLSFIMLKFFI